MSDEKVVKRDNVGKILQIRAGCRRGPAAPDPHLGAAQLPASGQADQAASRRLLRLGRATAAASTSAGSPAPPRPPTTAACWHEGLSYCSFEGKRFLLRDAVAEAGARADRQGHVGEVQALAGVLEVLRQHGADPAPHAPEARARQARPARRASPSATTSRRSTTTATTTSATRSWAWSRARPRTDVRRCLENWNKGDNGILDLSQGLSPEARHGLADPGRRAARPGLAVHLRAAVGQRRVRHVPVAGRRPRRALGPAGQGRAQGQAPGPRLHHRPARLGEERRSHFKDSTTTSSRSSPTKAQGWVRPLDRLRPGRRRAAVQRQGTDRRARREVHAQGPGRQRLDHRAGQRPDGQAEAADAGDDPLRRGDRGRGVHHARSRRRAAWRSRTPAASRWSACATSAPTRSPTCPTWATTRSRNSL